MVLMSPDHSPAGYVLVVDDDPGICELMELTLGDEGYAVITVSNADDALQTAQERDPALIVLDLSLPGTTAETLVGAYRALPRAKARLVVCSGAPGVEQEATRLGADGSLAKPFDLDHLLSIVGAALA
jgi:DNA-binding response OmpR family regulator